MASGNNDNSKRPAGGKRRGPRAFAGPMQTKLAVLFFAVLLAFGVLIVRLFIIIQDNGEEYKKAVLSQQSYDSRELPYKRGTITDSKGTVLASSELVYNVIVDAYQINAGSEDETTGESIYLEPTLAALAEIGVDTDTVRDYIHSNPDSRYYIVRKNLPYKDKVAFETATSEDKENGANVQGVWFEASYIRSYPNGTMLSNVLGFANNQNQGSFGIEGYYNDILNGTPGREYGYLNNDSNLERTTIAATDGYNLTLTIDANIQSIIEKYIDAFNEEYKDSEREGYGAEHVGCIIMDVNTGEILGMASYPNYDLSDPYDLSRIVGMPQLYDGDPKTGAGRDQPLTNESGRTVYMTSEDVAALENEDSEQKSRYLNALWRNFCISTYYEPGSTAKPFTLAAGLESGSMTGDETYYCGGYLNVGGWDIYCHNRKGDGMLTVDQAIERSCNVALMQMAQQTGIENFTKFQRIFGFGLRTNIDLADEARTDTLIISKDRMTESDLATNSFGQNFDVTMIQMITAFSSLVNGGNYYEPHVVSKITDASGATVQNIEPRLLKKTVSEDTSAKIREATLQVVEGSNGTGRTARPAGYRIGGKTGTAEVQPRDNGEYVISFLGYAPADDPQIATYVVIDRANYYTQENTRMATQLTRQILTEVLPYLGIYMTEELTAEEEQELATLHLENTLNKGKTDTTDDDTTDSQTVQASESALAAQAADAGNTAAGTRYWESYAVDPATGYYIDPATGGLIDPDTGYAYGRSTMGSDNAGSTFNDDISSTADTSNTTTNATGTTNTTDAADTADTSDTTQTN